MVDQDSIRPWEKVGISKTWWYAIKGGHRTPSLEIALQIYDVLGVQYGATEGLTPTEVDVLRKALHKSRPAIAMTAAKQLQLNDGELRRDSPSDAQHVAGIEPETSNGGKVSR